MMTRPVRNNRYNWLVPVAFAFFFVLVNVPVNGQTTGSIFGTVTDQRGAVVGGANVTVTNPGTRLNRTVTTDGNGSYIFPVLPVGVYDMTVEAQGFKPYEQRGLELQVAANLRVDFKLDVGQITERVV